MRVHLIVVSGRAGRPAPPSTKYTATEVGSRGLQKLGMEFRGHQHENTMVEGGFWREQLDRRHVADRSEQALVVEPPDPAQGGEFKVLHSLPSTLMPDQLRLVESDDGLGQGTRRIAQTWSRAQIRRLVRGGTRSWPR